MVNFLTFRHSIGTTEVAHMTLKLGIFSCTYLLSVNFLYNVKIFGLLFDWVVGLCIVKVFYIYHQGSANFFLNKGQYINILSFEGYMQLLKNL